MKFLAEDDQLTVTLEGVEVFFALKRKLVIKRSDIVDLQWQPKFKLDRRLWRIGGADIPRAVWAGRFIGGGKRYFLYIRGPKGLTWSPTPQDLQNILVITIQNSFYHEILLTCAPDIAASLLNWFHGPA
ncbi:MAG TPA: hypothetical protein VG604_02480 [Candidatus Saccharimonadales bacterium]|nr:hypothetical protein [Candidatus Saccharimonadales bacterium]